MTSWGRGCSDGLLVKVRYNWGVTRVVSRAVQKRTGWGSCCLVATPPDLTRGATRLIFSRTWKAVYGLVRTLPGRARAENSGALSGALLPGQAWSS